VKYKPYYSADGNWVQIGRRWVRLSDGFVLPVIQGGTSANTIMENIWAFGTDNGSESGHSLDTENTARTAQNMDENFTIRMMARETAGKNDPWSMYLFCSYNGGAFTLVDTTASAGMPCFVSANVSSRTDDEVTTHRLSNPASGSFTAGYFDDASSSLGTSNVSLSSQYSEWEFCVQLDSTYASSSDEFEFRLEGGSGGTDLDSYVGVTYPKATAYSAPVTHTAATTLSGVGTITAAGSVPVGQVLYIDYEEGDFSDHDSMVNAGGDISINGASTLVGTYSAALDATSAVGADAYGVNSFTVSTNEIRYRIYFKLSSDFAMGTAESFALASIRSTFVASNRVSELVIRESSGSIWLWAYIQNDIDNTDVTGDVELVLNTDYYAEVRVQRASTSTSADGYTQLILNGTPVAGVVADSDNYDNFPTISGSRLGGTSLDAGTSGTIYWDDFILRDDDTEIGPAATTKNSGAQLDGVGSITAAATVVTTHQAQSALAGAGLISAVPSITRSVTVQVDGVGSITAVGTIAAPLNSGAALSGAGSLSAAGSYLLNSGTSLDGVGTITAAGSKELLGITALNGVGSILAAASITRASATQLDGVGTIVVAGAIVGAQNTGAVLTGVGAIIPVPSITRSNQVALAGTGTITAAGTLGGVVHNSGVLLAGVGQISVIGTVTPALNSGAILSGIGAITPKAGVTFISAAALDGVGLITASGSILGTVTAAAIMTGTGTIVSNPAITRSSAAALASVGTISATAQNFKNAAALFSGVGTVQGIPVVLFAAVTALSGIGTITADGSFHYDVFYNNPDNITYVEFRDKRIYIQFRDKRTNVEYRNKKSEV